MEPAKEKINPESIGIFGKTSPNSTWAVRGISIMTSHEGKEANNALFFCLFVFFWDKRSYGMTENEHKESKC
jgi:hypothetical protein